MSGLKEKKIDTSVIMYTRERLLNSNAIMLHKIYTRFAKKKELWSTRFTFQYDLIEFTIKKSEKEKDEDKQYNDNIG